MMIDRIGSVEPLLPNKKSSRVENVQKNDSPDSVALSSEAIQKGELYQALELVSGTEDVREDRIAELKAKINDPAYINDTVLNKTADNIMAALGL
jgi:negative regulator of flagellin synthesis FlgM